MDEPRTDTAATKPFPGLQTNGDSRPISSTDEAQLLAAVTELLPPTAAEEVRRWERGEQSAVAAIERLQRLPGYVPQGGDNTTPQPRGLSAGDLARQIIEFEARFPPPDEKAILADCRWTQDHWIDEHISPYRGTHVAAFSGAVVGSGDDSDRLQLDTARRLNVHPQRIVVTYVPRGGGLF